MEQHAQDSTEPKGQDMGIAYPMRVMARRFYKKGVKQDEMMMLMEMVIVRGDKGEVVGRIATDMSGGFVVSDDLNQEQWHIDARQVWDSYVAMRSNVAEVDK